MMWNGCGGGVHSVLMLSSICHTAWLVSVACRLRRRYTFFLPLRIVAAECAALCRCLIRASERS